MGRWKDYRIYQKKKCYICVTFSLHFCNENVTLLIQGEGTVSLKKSNLPRRLLADAEAGEEIVEQIFAVGGADQTSERIGEIPQ